MKATLLAAALCAAATPAYAQVEFLTELFKDVNSVALSVQGGGIPGSGNLTTRGSDCPGGGVCGMFAEVLIDLPDVGGTELELGLGTGYMRGFRAREESLDLHGSMRSFPVVSAYATFPEIERLARIEPYAGLSVGGSQLWNARGYDPEGTVFGVEGETLDFGATAGLFLTPLGGLFVEGAYRVRRFESVTWELPESAGERLPSNWPRSLDASGWTLSLGWQFRFRDEAKKEDS
jgi:opacity protein-like surface antigen